MSASACSCGPATMIWMWTNKTFIGIKKNFSVVCTVQTQFHVELKLREGQKCKGIFFQTCLVVGMLVGSVGYK